YVCGDEIPGAPDLEVSDNCSENVTVILEEDTVGNTYPYLDCTLTTSEPSQAGETWSMFLEYNGDTHYFVLDENGATFTESPLGGGMFEAHITGTVVNAENNDEAWLIDVYLINKTDYDGWTSQNTIGNPSVPRQAKNFFGISQPGDELGWDFWEVDNSRAQLIGLGDYGGDILVLAHAPANYLFGFEVGMNANSYSEGFGIGGWFTFSGTIAGVSASGQGDLAFNADCPPCEYTITRTWTATDDCGNSTVVEQVITVNAPENIIDGNDGSVQVAVQAEEVGFVKAYPNPTGAQATLVYRVPADADVIIEVVNPSGKSIDNVFNGRAYAGVDNYAQFDGTAYDNGLYIVRMTTENNVFYQKVMLQK
ncbi:MAG: T9SS type A sorting domain-containing protein, partial [Flavobacteriales bacterium]|nr:T9SS type A sorting domain-containing protein [Flavobacteriales bacterium]